MNRFYSLPKWWQWTVASLFMLVSLAFLGYFLVKTGGGLLFLFLFPLVAPFFQFTWTPFFTLTGGYQYLSPMLLAYFPRPEKYDLHNGTGWDYYWVMRGIPRGRPTQNRLLAYYLEGLLRLCDMVENEELPETVEISGTSYFFSETTAKRLGFELVKPSIFLQVNLYFNYLDLLWMYSRSKGRLAFPNVGRVKAVRITGGDLLKKRPQLQKLHQYLLGRIPIRA